jgi:hypothetical protein
MVCDSQMLYEWTWFESLTNVPGVDRKFTNVCGLGELEHGCGVWMMFTGYSQHNPALLQWLH